ncbi:hypothetical protein ELQ39_00550 [Streptomyces sp. GB4-14]|nr:hypothetical protein [Streptomyces sp. GB4-14]
MRPARCGTAGANPPRGASRTGAGRAGGCPSLSLGSGHASSRRTGGAWPSGSGHRAARGAVLGAVRRRGADQGRGRPPPPADAERISNARWEGRRVRDRRGGTPHRTARCRTTRCPRAAPTAGGARRSGPPVRATRRMLAQRPGEVQAIRAGADPVLRAVRRRARRP